jgi:AraC-like DNA-binding protein
VVNAGDPAVVECVPAQLEPILNFELGILPGIHHRDHDVCSFISIGGAQTAFSGCLDLWPGVESFAIFFQPAGWSLVFKLAMYEITNRMVDAIPVMGSCVRRLWNRLGEVSAFEERVGIVEDVLLPRAASATPQNRITAAATYLFHRHGCVHIPKLAGSQSMGLRQFERRFEREIGVSPKAFARVARFQAALDAKLAAPQRTWLDIACTFGYYDQMHMIHDFEKLGRSTPTALLAEMGDVRPPALVTSALPR